MDTKGKNSVTIESDIPPGRIMTIDLKFPATVQQRHGCEGLENHISKYLERPDPGFSFSYAYTRKDTRVLVPPTRTGQAIYLASESTKLRYLSRLFEKEGLSDGNLGRWLVFTHWPLIMWMTEMFLDALSIPYIVIRSQMTTDQQNEAVELFTAPSSPYKVLLTTYTCGAFGLNLQTYCSRVVCMEPPLNLATLFQGSVRLHRIGQKSKQRVWILFDDDEGDVEPIEADLINKEADKELCRLLGHNRSRLFFSNVHDLGYEPDNELFAPPSTKKLHSKRQVFQPRLACFY
ncbi:P-loop containing nucleoside triphosphate hydrolase protein [Aspergillus caelatus]|uniref:P-loop containing nucleoside triphosphate hydrolase protein n=1 Tax=Aspergillus caelatus TaxID=61420 RepID=A0A5N6ZHY9_9EURO|nr:P-loop containing nucleoside triphosphate hydrolase protein [Aspergillus caelatus]KAE8357262.1 P-loop containing nucleoside triphosphate hydrolase protein [Aspergillus caelatus]